MTEAAAAETPTETSEPTRDALVRKVYGIATKRLREAHLDEFRDLQKEEAAKFGVDWTPTPTAEEKAREKVAQLLRENPTIKTELVEEIAAQVKGQPEA